MKMRFALEETRREARPASHQGKWAKNSTFGLHADAGESKLEAWQTQPKGPHSEVGSMQNFLDLLDVTADELTHLLAQATNLKTAWKQGDRTALLLGRVLGLIFEKPSLRTRVSFQTAMAQLGG